MEHDCTDGLAYPSSHFHMKKKKLMIAFWDLDIGGIQTVIRDVILYLHATHPEIEVTLLIRNKTDSQLIKDIQRKTHTTIYWARENNAFSLVRHFSFWFIAVYLVCKPDILLTFLRRLSVGSLVIRTLLFWRHVRVVLNEGIVTSTYNSYQKHPQLWNFLISTWYRHADVIIVPSEACKTDLISHFSIPANLIKIGKNWTLLPKKTSKARRYDLMYVGRLDKEKNLIACIDLVQRLRTRYPHITLCLLGKGQEEQLLRTVVANRHLQKHIFFAGYHADVASYLTLAKIFVMTTHNEGIPIALLEAGSQGLPSVVTRFEGSSEVVKHGKTGFIADSPRQMSVYISTLLDDEKKRKQMGTQARQFVRSRYGKDSLKVFVDYLLGL